MNRRCSTVPRRMHASPAAIRIVLALLLVVLSATVSSLAVTPTQARAVTQDPSGPTASLNAPATTTSSSAKASFTVSWAASPALPSNGFDAYRVEYREPGTGCWLAWKTAATERSASFPGQAGHAYEFRVAATKTADASVVGPWSAVRPAVVPADDAAFKVTKKWTQPKASGAYLGKLRVSAVKKATATYTFQGTRIALVAPRGRSYGKVGVYVRSLSGSTWTAYKLAKTVDLYAGKTRARVATTVRSFPASETGVQRQVKLVVTGKKNKRSRSSKVAFDGLAVQGAPRAAGAYQLNVTPTSPSVDVAGQLHFSAEIPDCMNQDVEWSVYRTDRAGGWYTEEAGSITAAGLYTAPDLPTNTASDAGDNYRQYWVKAVAAANPDELVCLIRVTVTRPAPTISSFSPLSVREGGTVTIMGTNLSDPSGAAPKVFFSSFEATVTSHSDTRITAVVPGGWAAGPTSVTVTLRVETWGQRVFAPSHVTVTDITTPPRVSQINGYPYDTDGQPDASPGDTLHIGGYGFSSNAGSNQVRFSGGAVVVPTAYEPGNISYYGVLSVTVPDGAQTGTLQVRRSGTEWGDGATVTINPATVATAALHPCFGGLITGPQMVSNGSWTGTTGPEEWLLQGTNFTKLRLYNYSPTTPGVFWLDMRRGGVTKSRVMRAVSDTLAVPHRTWGEQTMMPDDLFADAQPGDTVELRIRGEELTNLYERSSGWVPISLGERPYYGSIEYLPASQLVSYWGSSHTVAKGSWLHIVPGASTPTQQLTAPGLWEGTLPMGTDGIGVKMVPLDRLGTYTITNHTTGESTELVVAEVGERYTTCTYGRDTQLDLAENGVRMRSDGAEVTVPAGAFSADDLGASSYFSVRLAHATSNVIPWDPTVTDGGHHFSLSVVPTVTHLLKPITVSIPYDPSGRTTTPFLGMWDASSSLYYDFKVSGAQIDTLNHKLTYTIPAGTYPATVSSSSAAVETSSTADTTTARATALTTAADTTTAVSSPTTSIVAASPTGITFNQAFRQVGAVSAKVATSGEDYVWHSPRAPNSDWGIHVDAITDPTSTSYVSSAKAQQVLEVAVATWENLVGKGWSEPEAMITLTVRDYGDPGVYQGATTKGVFGQPWVYVNSNLTAGTQLATAVSHEMGHVFQRQLTTNISTAWVDEAVAEWVAWDTLGAACDLHTSFEAGDTFPTAAFPSSFWSGYTQEQAYGAGAFIIWLADTYGPTAVLNIYDTLAYRPTYWQDARATFEEATGHSVPELVLGFATEFWMQTYEPINAFTWTSRVIQRLSDYPGSTATLSLPADASQGLVFAPSAGFATTLQGQPVVARAPALPQGAVLDVYWDGTTASAIPSSTPIKLGTLSDLTSVVDLGTYASGCYRVVAVTPARSPLSASLTVETVHLGSISPNKVPKAGGTVVTLSGCGFGDQKSSVTVGAASVSGTQITSWTDTEIVFTMPNMGSETGTQAVTVRPMVGGPSNAVDMTVY